MYDSFLFFTTVLFLVHYTQSWNKALSFFHFISHFIHTVPVLKTRKERPLAISFCFCILGGGFNPPAVWFSNFSDRFDKVEFNLKIGVWRIKKCHYNQSDWEISIRLCFSVVLSHGEVHTCLRLLLNGNLGNVGDLLKLQKGKAIVCI